MWAALLVAAGPGCRSLADSTPVHNAAFTPPSAQASRYGREPARTGKPLNNVLGLRLKATFAVRDHDLVLRYEVVNGSDQDAYLMNRLAKWDQDSASHVMSPDVVLVTIERGELAFSKKLADVLPGVYEPIAPYVTPLRAHGTFSEDVIIALPVREFNQYRTALNGRTQECKRASFTLGYYVRPAGTRERSERVHNQSVIIPETPRGLPLQFGAVTSGVIDLPGAVQAMPFDVSLDPKRLGAVTFLNVTTASDEQTEAKLFASGAGRRGLQVSIPAPQASASPTYRRNDNPFRSTTISSRAARYSVVEPWPGPLRRKAR